MIERACTNDGARHIRGRVLPAQWRLTKVPNDPIPIGNGWSWQTYKTKGVRDYYWVEVFNTRTNIVVYRGDAFGFKDAVDLCDRAVGVARWSWQMGLKHKELI